MCTSLFSVVAIRDQFVYRYMLVLTLPLEYWTNGMDASPFGSQDFVRLVELRYRNHLAMSAARMAEATLVSPRDSLARTTLQTGVYFLVERLQKWLAVTSRIPGIPRRSRTSPRASWQEATFFWHIAPIVQCFWCNMGPIEVV